jgi:hypothetical protein
MLRGGYYDTTKVDLMTRYFAPSSVTLHKAVSIGFRIGKNAP